MSKIRNEQSVGSKLADDVVERPTKTLGRKRDHTRDAEILEASIDILAEAGFEGMTMDMVAARAKAGKATMYRRWSSKTELVRDALTWMNRNHLELDLLPDTGTLRNDLLTLLKPQSIEEGERKLRVLAGLGSFFTQNPESVNGGIFEPWVAVNKELMRRAVSRGEIPVQADIEMACQVIVSMASYRGLVQRKTFDTRFYTELIEGVLLPALKSVREH
jgi:AcrR family transcriptional regulator